MHLAGTGQSPTCRCHRYRLGHAARGGVDRSPAALVADTKRVALVPAILAYLKANPRDPYFFATLAAFGATCAARTIAQLANGPWNEAFAVDALAKLSGHADGPRQAVCAGKHAGRAGAR